MHLYRTVRERMNLEIRAAAVIFAALTVACGGSTTSISEVAAPDAVRCQTSVTPAPSTIPHSGSQISLTVVAGRECAWTARSEAAWARVSPANGQGEAALSLTIAANPDASTRSGAIAVNDARLSLTQEAAPCRFQLGNARVQMSFDGGRSTVSVTTLGGCTWRATSNAEWARVLVDSGTGSGTVEIAVAANPGSERTATISIADQSFAIVQEGRSSALPPGPGAPPSPGCTITLDPAERTFGAGGGDGSIRVNAPNGCAWSAVESSAWIELSGSTGTGTDTVGYRVAANMTTAARSDTITIAGRTHTVRQNAGTASGGGGGGGGGGEEQRIDLSGLAVFIDGSCPSITFLLEFRRVFTTSDTRFRDGNCRDIRTGTSLRVEGRVQSDGRVRATEVRIRDGDN